MWCRPTFLPGSRIDCLLTAGEIPGFAEGGKKQRGLSTPKETSWDSTDINLFASSGVTAAEVDCLLLNNQTANSQGYAIDLRCQ